MYGLRTDVHFRQGFWDSSVFRYFVGINCLPVIVVVVWVDRSLLCVIVDGLWRTWSWLCCWSVCVVSPIWELLFSVCAWAFTLVSPTASFLFAFHWLMHWAFRFLLKRERYFFFGVWLVTSPIFATGFSALIQISLTDTALVLTCKSQVIIFHLHLVPSTCSFVLYTYHACVISGCSSVVHVYHGTCFK